MICVSWYLNVPKDMLRRRWLEIQYDVKLPENVPPSLDH